MEEISLTPSSQNAPAAGGRGEFDRTITDVCQIFQQVTGGLASPAMDGVVVAEYIRELKWSNHEFRLLFEYEWASNRDYLSKPGHCNIRTILNPARRQRLIDVVNDLKRAKEIEKRAKELGAYSPHVKIYPIKLLNGEVFCQRYVKVSAADGKMKWEWELENKEQYEQAWARILSHETRQN